MPLIHCGDGLLLPRRRSSSAVHPGSAPEYQQSLFALGPSTPLASFSSLTTVILLCLIPLRCAQRSTLSFSSALYSCGSELIFPLLIRDFFFYRSRPRPTPPLAPPTWFVYHLCRHKRFECSSFQADFLDDPPERTVVPRITFVRHRTLYAFFPPLLC